MINIDAITTKAIELLLAYAPKLILAIITLVVGLKLINYLTRTLDKVSKKKDFDKSLRHFLISIAGISLKVLLAIMVASMIGVETTSLVAVLGAAGLAVGLALQGSLANFAGGVLILAFKPFEVGDYIEAQGEQGDVKKIEIFNTIIKTRDNKTIVIPNGILSNGVIVNHTKEDKRRLDQVFGIGYGDDMKLAVKVIEEIAANNKKVLKNPQPFVRLGELGDSSLNITSRVWCKTDDYWSLRFDMIEQVKEAFDKNKISIPYPQMDIHMHR